MHTNIHIYIYMYMYISGLLLFSFGRFTRFTRTQHQDEAATGSSKKRRSVGEARNFLLQESIVARRGVFAPDRSDRACQHARSTHLH